MKTNNKKQKQEVDRKKLDEMTEDSETRPAPKYVLPSVKLNGKVGSFYRTIIEDEALKLDDDGKALLEDMGKSVKGTILRVRKTYFADEAELQMFTNETSAGKNERISVFCKTENIKGGHNITNVFSGTSAEIKERYPEMSMIQVIYFLLEDTNEIVRLKVKGMSLGQLFDYFKSFENNERKYEYITELGVKPDKNKYGKFYVNTFKRGKKIEDLSVIETSIREVYEKITEIEEYYKESFKDNPVEFEKVEPKIDEKPLTDKNVKESKKSKDKYDTSLLNDEDEINVEDIPL